MNAARVNPSRVIAELPEYVIANGTIRVGDEIGAGAMGQVFRGEHVRLGRAVAVKFLSDSLASDAAARLRFEREARALAELSHPNVVALYDAGEEDGTPYLVMEFVDGAPLSSMLPLDPERAISIMLSVCDAVAYVHERGIVHRDLKPENVLVRKDDVVKVTDFGLARAVSRSGWTLTEKEQAVGTPYHIAPELLRGQPANEASDVYALGVLLYRMLTGKLPLGQFERAPGTLDAICRKAMADDVSRRYVNVAALKRDLQDALRERVQRTTSLPSDERQWLRAVAILHMAATATTGWAALVSLTPKVMSASELGIAGLVDRLHDDSEHILSLARFEVWPTLGALTAIAFALMSQALLRRHWSRNGLDTPAPDEPLEESKWLFVFGLLAILTYEMRRHLDPNGSLFTIVRYAPFYGALMELGAMYIFWCGALEAMRRSRALSREPLLWLGSALMLLPPTLELVAYVERQLH